MSERYAVIDVGTNTVRELVAAAAPDGRVEFVHSAKALVRLGRDVAEDGRIGKRKVIQIADIVSEFVDEAATLGAREVRAIATAAAREASNGDELVEQVRARSGLTLEIIDEETEARLAFTGALSVLEYPLEGDVGVVDVGGGSTEIVVGSVGGGIAWSRSFRLGSGRLADTLLEHDPPRPFELERARAQIDAALPPADEVPTPAHAVAVAGSASNLRRMVGPLLDLEALERALRILTERPSRQVARQFGIDSERARILPAGALILSAAAERLGRPLWFCRGGIREGALLELVAARTGAS